MGEQLRFLARCLTGGLCSIVLFCTSCRHAPPHESGVRTVAEAATNKAERSGTYHEVKQGQTLWSIARVYGVDVQTLARVNKLSDITALYAGQKLYVSGITQRREIVSRCPCRTDTAKPSSSAKPFAEILRPLERSSMTKAISVSVSIPKEAMLERMPWIWPVQGEVARGFEQDATHRHDGIDIVAPRGSLIQAAADGEVIFSDWGPGGYGRIVILQHRVDVVTIYAHNHTNLVHPGQHVRQGDPIATVGQSGRATGNHLHFEVRYKAVPLSPYKLLPRRPSNIAALDRG